MVSAALWIISRRRPGAYEFTDMYLGFIVKPNRKATKARLAFHMANEAEKRIIAVSKALQAVEQSQDYPAEGFVLCRFAVMFMKTRPRITSISAAPGKNLKNTRRDRFLTCPPFLVKALFPLKPLLLLAGQISTPLPFAGTI